MNGSADFNRNNLDCLRLVLASIVALYHISALTDLPAFALLGKYCSPHVAVHAFFVISGLLIYRSYIRSSTAKSYFEKRVRRIYPAYFTTIVIASLALFLLSSIPASHYFGFGFWKYLIANLLFLNFLAPSLPGVFTANPISAVNGALWTLKIEVLFYLFVPVIHALCNKFGTKPTVGAIFLFSSLWKYGFTLLAAIHDTPALFSLDASRNLYSQLSVQFPAQMAYFSAGILLLLYLEKLQKFFPVILGLTTCLFLVDHFFTGEVLDIFWISGFVFCFGFWHYFGNFSKYGDFSYGVYIVHWPTIQILIALGLARLNPVVFFLCCISLIALISLSMWHFIESKCLASSNHYRRATTVVETTAIYS